MQIVDVQPNTHRVQANFVSSTVSVTGTDSFPSYPHRKAGGIVITTIPFFAHGSAAEFAAGTTSEPSIAV